MDAGELRERLDILALEPTGETGYVWRARRRVWGKVTLTGKSCYFSKIGIGARAAEVVLRAQPLDLTQALQWGDKHLFLQEVLPPERGYMTVQTAVAETGEWTALGDGKPDVTFPAAITERYIHYAQEEPMATHDINYILVTPKAVELRPSDLVSNLDTAKGVYVVTACHTVDPWKNEYEIIRREEP